MYKLGKHRGDALISSVVAAAVTGALCLGIAKTVTTTMNTQAKVVGSVHATTYADSRIKVLKNTPYSQLHNLPKTKIENTGDSNAVYYESVEFGEETTTEPIGRWAYINIYEGENEKPVDTFRYFLLKDGMSGVPKGTIVMWHGLNIPEGWHICDGTNGTPDMRNRFIVGAGDEYSLNSEGGSMNKTLTIEQMPAHNHGGSTVGAGNHAHNRGNMEISGSILAMFFGHANNAGALYYSSLIQNSTSPDWANDFTEMYGTLEFKASRNWSGETSYSGDHSHSIFSQGGSQPIDIRPRYLAVYYIMKL